MKFNVPDKSCGHRATAIKTKSVRAADLAASAACDLTDCRRRSDSIFSSEQLAAAIKEADYDPAPVAA